MSVMPPSPLSYTGEVATPYITKTFAPTSSNNKFSVPTIWVDTDASDIYILARNEYIAGVRTAEWVKVGNDSGTVEGFKVDAFTAPGTNPVLPIDVGGVLTVEITGGQVAAGTTTDVIQTNSLAANEFTIQIQRASAESSSTVGANGVSHFNSTHFSVDSEGFVSLIGGGLAVDSFTPDTGTSPVVPNASGNISLIGQTPANTSGIRVTGGTNSLELSLFSPFVGDFAFTSSTAAATRTLTISNSDNTAASDSGAAQIISVGGSTQTGDPYTRWSVGSAFSYSCGIDTSDTPSDPSWKLTHTAANSATPSTGTVMMEITPDGLIQFPTANGTIANDGVLIGTAITINAANFLKIGDVETGSTATVDATTEAGCGYGATSTTADAYVNLNAFGVQGYFILSRRSDAKFVINDSNGIGDLLTITAAGLTTIVTAGAGLAIGNGGPTVTSGSGAPGATQPKGSLYLRTDGSGVNDRAYINTDGSTAWTAIVTVG